MRQRTRHILLSFPKREDVDNFKRLLATRGRYPAVLCNSGAQTLSAIGDLGESVVICGFRLRDMVFSDLAEDLPDGSVLLLIANPARVEEIPDNVVFLPTPLKPQEFHATLDMLAQGITPGKHGRNGKKGARPQEEQLLINEAKAILMERHRMTEPEAHRYLQRRAMENGCDLVETAQMLIALNE
ncbi:MAG: ANTAR domain-containing protein [Lachnospiraceae bacterium]|nr:ANTAR domain-containing protein [Lachnospiraceae bacterium]